MSLTAENLRFTTVMPMDIFTLDPAAVSPAWSDCQFHTLTPLVEDILTDYEWYKPGYAVKRDCGTTDWLLLYTVSGRGRFGRGPDRLILEEDDIALVRPGTPHDYTLEDEAGYWGQLWFHFHPRPHWYEWLTWPEVLPGVLLLRLNDLAIRSRTVASLWEAHHLATGGLPRQADFARNALETALLWCDTQNPQTERGRLDSRVLAVMDFLCRNLSASIDWENLSQLSSLSPSWLSHLFHAQVGLPPAQFLDQQRLTHAKSHLQNTIRPVAVIAAEVGMDPAYFSHWFKRHTAVNPRQYRQTQQKD